MRHPFSVLMSVYAKDRPAWVCRSLDSIFLNTVKPSEVVIVIDGPISVQLRGILSEFSHKYPQIKLCQLAKNGGLGPALAYGLQQCSHELVARMDADDISLPDRFEKQLAYFNANSDVAILGSCFQEIDANSLKPINVHSVPQTDNKIRRCVKTQCPFQHGTVMFKKSAAIDSGNYESYPMFLDDYYLWVRILGKGYKGANLSDVLVSMPKNPDLTWGRALYLFLADRNLCSTMRQLKLMGSFTYYRIVIGRFIKYFLIPNCLRIRKKWIYN